MKPFKLDDHNSKKPPFGVPDKYFDQLNKSIINRTIEKKKVVSFKPLYLLAIAASITLIAVIGINLTKVEGTLSAEEMLSQISTDEISLYLDTYDFTETELINEFNNDEMDPFENGLEFIEDEDLDELLLDELIIDTNIN